MSKLTYMLGAMLLAVVMATSARAALITFDVRVIGTTGVLAGPVTSKGVAFAPGQVGTATVTLGLFADVFNGDGNAQNDGFQVGYFSLLSAESSGALTQGDISVPTIDPNFTSGPGHSLGVQANLDANPDLEVGSNNNGSATNWIDPSNASPVFGTGPTTGAPGITELLLGTTVWTASGPGVGPTQNDLTAVNFGLRNSSGFNGSFYHFNTDGVSKSLNGTNANVALGAPVVITGPVPEPATIGILGMALAGLALRRRRDSVA